MNPAVEAVTRAVLYEGYVLYPYRASATKNRHRWSPGGLSPGAGFRAECLVLGDVATTLTVRVRFLQSQLRFRGDAITASEAMEREVVLPATAVGELSAPRRPAFEFPQTPDHGGELRRERVEGQVGVLAESVAAGVFRVAVTVSNLTPRTADREREELGTLASAHAVLECRGGEFASLTDPPPELRVHAAACRNEGVWPILVGTPGNRDTLLASPIILPDYPEIAPESVGDFFDGTEIDEMLALRVLTLTEAEKREMGADPRTRAILDRVESLTPAQLGRLHGAVRSRSTGPKPGDRVRLQPRGRADAFDVLLAGRAATVLSIEEDFEGLVYLAVAIEDDPAQDFAVGGQPGHRFFFRPEEVELLSREHLP